MRERPVGVGLQVGQLTPPQDGLFPWLLGTFTLSTSWPGPGPSLHQLSHCFLRKLSLVVRPLW